VTDVPDPANVRRGDMKRVVTVGDLLRVLADHPPDLPIYLADWNEGYDQDWPLAAEEIVVLDSMPVRDKLGNLLFEQPRRLCLGGLGDGDGGKEHR